ncbi:SDR family oxidoreductase [Flavobacterium subsaxonicum]|uniref:Short-chain dehydrogenase n=1 Tax=Flavobacterium subsaxonicum WB 4.1-42 = DSM 21790 TaxID=1121898 RepID=A0A0A2MU25_9FLAO|nr:SDR family oxidoreductase [Flavobacterium subsaxonicum]KGO91705.1 short-chain dehydrogenase [Flavobacterium subsaxonicum WB 4.1-42 = DSM 21790]
MKTIFITGASAGLGKATAQLFQSKGWSVIATMRNPEKETELNLLPNVTLLPLDVTNPDQIWSTAQKAIALGNIDVAFNNAGYGLFGALEACTDDQITDQIATNLTGVLRVTQAFIPHFREKKSGLFITTTSVCGLTSNPLSSVYNATKWALEGWSESIAYELAPFNIGIKTVAPGGIKSKFMQGMKSAGHSAYEPLAQKLNEVFSNGLLIFTEPEIIAQSVYEAATDGKDQLTYVAGIDAISLIAKRQAEGADAFRIGMTKLFEPETATV